jgi:hypothetical protein
LKNWLLRRAAAICASVVLVRTPIPVRVIDFVGVVATPVLLVVGGVVA